MANAGGILTPALSVAVALLCWLASAGAETVTFGPPVGNNDWSNSSNWSPAGPEGNDVEIGTYLTNYSTIVDADFTIGSLTVPDGAAVGIASGKTLTITGSATDNGTITINSNQAGGLSTLNFDGGVVSGQGTISLNLLNYAQVTGTLTQQLGHTISGTGEISAALTNNGFVYAIALAMPLTLETSDMVNNGSMGGPPARSISRESPSPRGSTVSFSRKTAAWCSSTGARRSVAAISSRGSRAAVLSSRAAQRRSIPLPTTMGRFTSSMAAP